MTKKDLKTKVKTRQTKKTPLLKTKAISNGLGLAGTLGTVGLLASVGIASREHQRFKMIQEKENYLSTESIENKGYIPKIIHQIWIGDQSKRPRQIMDTWKKYCEKNSGFLFGKWEYKLWTDKEINDFGLKNKVEYMNSKSYPQKADIARYEIIERYGGFYVDADMYCMGNDLEKFIDFNNHFIGVMEPFGCNSFENIQEPYIANGFFACTPRHPIMQRCIKNIPQRIKLNKKVYIQTGPGLLNEVIYSPITILPSKWVFPVSFKTFKTTNNIESFKDKSLVFTKSGYEIATSSKNVVRKLYE